MFLHVSSVRPDEKNLFGNDWAGWCSTQTMEILCVSWFIILIPVVEPNLAIAKDGDCRWSAEILMVNRLIHVDPLSFFFKEPFQKRGVETCWYPIFLDAFWTLLDEVTRLPSWWRVWSLRFLWPLVCARVNPMWAARSKTWEALENMGAIAEASGSISSATEAWNPWVFLRGIIPKWSQMALQWPYRFRDAARLCSKWAECEDGPWNSWIYPECKNMGKPTGEG